MITFLDSLLLQPLILICSSIFAAMPYWIDMGGRILLFSIVLNFLLLPLYLQMEKGLAARNALRARIAADVARMKRHFRGRERYFYVRAVYRQYGYHPIYELLRSGDLLLQIVVFSSVYRFLANFDGLQGWSFWLIADLSEPDRLLGGINLMPFVMTAINIAAVFAYIEDRARRTQALMLAFVFMVLLYSSPSGLVLYWTMNNLFSLLRTWTQRSSIRLWPRFVSKIFGKIAAQT